MPENDILATWEKNLALLEAYESLLTQTQREVLDLYFRFNLSLSEIAEQRGTSRTAIADAIKKGIAKLNHYEEALGLCEKQSAAEKTIRAVEEASTLEEAKAALPELRKAFHDN